MELIDLFPNLRNAKGLLYKILFCVLLALLYHFTEAFCRKQTDNFSVARIHSDLVWNSDWETPALNPEAQSEVSHALSQKFYYLGCGGQCFAFESEDGHYVIKFFKHKIRKPYRYFLDLNPHKFKKIFRKIHRDFVSQKIAFEDLPEETGLLYVHLNKGSSLSHSTCIVDKIGIEHCIALDQVEFVLQRKAQLIYDHFAKLMAAGDLLQAKQAVHALLETVIKRCKKGIYDEDPSLHRNFGFIGEKPMFIDTGRFVRDDSRKDPAVYKKDLETITNRLRHWLNTSYPELTATLDEALHSL